MSDFIRVASLADLPPGSRAVVEVKERTLALFNIEGRIYAIDNWCSHRGGPLGEGPVKDGVVSCPWHGWQFDLRTGKSPLNPAAEVETFETKIEGDDILVAV